MSMARKFESPKVFEYGLSQGWYRKEDVIEVYCQQCDNRGYLDANGKVKIRGCAHVRNQAARDRNVRVIFNEGKP